MGCNSVRQVMDCSNDYKFYVHVHSVSRDIRFYFSTLKENNIHDLSLSMHIYIYMCVCVCILNS